MPHPRHLGQILTSTDLTDWLAYSQLEPWGETAADIRTAAQIAARFEPHRDVKRRPEQFRFEDFLHWLKPAPPPVDEIDAQVAAFDRMFGVK